MANFTTNVDTVIASQASKEVTINAALDAASQALTYGRRASTSSGLTWGYYGGNVVKTDGTMAQIANGTLTLTASNTNYIVAAKATGAVSVSTANTNWLNQTDYWRLYSVVAGAATVTGHTDSRDFMQRPATGGGGMATPALGGTGQDFSGVAKGGIISGTGSGAFGLTSVGTDGQVLSADAASAGGVKWVAIPGGGDMLLGTAQTVTAAKTFDDGTMILKGATSGTTTLKSKDTFTGTVTLPESFGDAAAKNTGTGASDVAAGNHNHSGTYEPADATILKDADIGATVQAYDADLTTWAGVTPGTGVATALAVNVGASGAVVTNGGALGTPSSGTLTNCTGLPIAGGGTGQTTAQDAINALTAVSAATNEYVLTKDTATGNAIFKAAAGGSGSGDFKADGSVPMTGDLQMGNNQIVFEGTADDYETTLDFVDPTADRTITFPNKTGTVVVGESITTSGLTMNTDKMLGRSTAAAGAIEEIATASSAEMIAGTLTALRGMTPALIKSAIKALALTTPTAVSASGTSIDFTGITSDVSVIFVGFAGLSTNGTSLPIIQLGDSGGLENTGYLGSNIAIPNAAANAGQTMSSGFGLAGTGVSDASAMNGLVVIYNLQNTHTWAAAGINGFSNGASVVAIGGHKTLSAQLDRLSITTAGGTDAFDSGTVSISYL